MSNQDEVALYHIVEDVVVHEYGITTVGLSDDISDAVLAAGWVPGNGD